MTRLPTLVQPQAAQTEHQVLLAGPRLQLAHRHGEPLSLQIHGGYDQHNTIITSELTWAGVQLPNQERTQLIWVWLLPNISQLSPVTCHGYH